MKYWLNTATQDWKVAGHLFEKGDYSYALFFGHLTLEKTLKAIYVKKQDETPPFSHNLVYLCEKAGLELQQNNLELLEVKGLGSNLDYLIGLGSNLDYLIKLLKDIGVRSSFLTENH